MSNINEKPELHAVKDGIQAIKAGLDTRNAKLEEIEARVDAIDAATTRGAADLKTYTTGNASKDDGARTLGAAIGNAFRKFHGGEVSRDFTETNSAVVVPQPTFAGITRLLEEKSLVRQLARVIPMTSQTLNVPTVTSIVSGTWYAEGGTIAGETTTAFGSRASSLVTAEAVAVLGKISRELDEDAIVAMSTVLGEIYADALATAENEAFLTHDGTSGTPFDGLFEDSAITHSTNSTAAGAGSDTMAEVLTYDNLVTCLMELPTQHQSRASWIMSPSVWAEIMKLVDGDSRPLIAANGFADGAAPKLLGRPVYVCSSAPAFNATTAADQAFIACGDYMTACVLGDRQSLEVEVNDSVFMTTRERAILVSQRIGFRTVLPGAIRTLSTDIA